MNTGNINGDLTGIYPDALISYLDTYNELQDIDTSEFETTILDHVNQMSIDNTLDAKNQIDIRNSGIIQPRSFSEQVNSINYINASETVNIANNNTAHISNTKYNTINTILTMCREISHSAHLTHEASKIYTKSQIDTNYIIQLTYLPSEITSTNVQNITAANNATSDASGNTSLYLSKTIVLLENAQMLTINISNNLKLISAFNVFVQSVEKTLLDSLSNISQNELLSNQFQVIESDSSNNPLPLNAYSPNNSINDALTISNLALISLNNFITSIRGNNGITADITNSILEVTILANTLDSIASVNNIYADQAISFAIRQIEALNNTTANKISISILNIDNIPDPSISTAVIAARKAKQISIKSDISASNAREVSNALIDLKSFYYNVSIIDADIISTSLSSLDRIVKVLTYMNTVITNTSVNLVSPTVNRASNSISGELLKITNELVSSNNYASDIYNIYTSITSAISSANSTIPTSIMSTQNLFWILNTLTEKVEKVTNSAKDQALLSSKNAHSLVTPRSIAIQTYSANVTGASIINNVARAFRNSSNSKIINPVAYNSFKADIRAKDVLLPVYNIKSNKMSPLTTLNKVLEKITSSTQRINDMSRISFRQK